ncbi:phosphoglucosamine mutase [candidate division KSB1 bacterium]|nr:phosphoglucosamine mutase [candidate division KSB1 bacterium]RQW01842.1 MAG: phosphoglucosamine mutase [candidate division KSB1 bacterium]
MISVSGVRGIIGDGLTPEIAMQFAQAYGSEFPGRVVVGRDSRVSGEMLKYAVWSGLMAVGCDVLDIDLASTPTTALVTERPDHAGGIILTASHNPKQWNALKLLAPDGLFLRQKQGEKIVNRVENADYNLVAWDKIGRVHVFQHAAEQHIDAILNLSLIDVDLIRSKKFKIVIDCCNGAGAAILPQLFAALGCVPIFLNQEPNGLFPRNPEPVPENLGDLSRAVLEHNADLGLAVDPDVDRLALVSEEGNPLGEEYTLVLVTKFVLSKTPGDVVVNLSTTRAIDDIAKQVGGRVFRTKVGEINVAVKAKQIGAVIAGEGNGGVIYPELHIGRDAPVGIALMLQYMAESGKNMSALHASVPHYSMIKDKIELGFAADARAIVNKLAEQHADENINTLDGLKLLYENSWIHIRASNTEPIIRVIAEAPTTEQASAMVEVFKKKVKDFS